MVELLVRKGSNFYGALYLAVQNVKVYRKYDDKKESKETSIPFMFYLLKVQT